MAGRDRPRSPDPDDWFADPDRASRPDRLGARPAVHPAGPPAEDDWIGDEPRSRARWESGLAASLPEGWVPVAAGALLVLVLLFGGLAVAGVFSGSKHNNAPPAVTSTPLTTAPTTSTPAVTVPAPATTLKPGDTGAQVKLLQRALAHLGYSVGKVDGDYGTATKSAVTEFQTASHLTADGVFGPATRAALIKALNNP
ncbi:MAG: peptidoglycan-binding protein [Gaiellaceae bacterium]